MRNGDIFRILNGYNNCGNICGRINVFGAENQSGCYGMDMTKHRYLRVQSWSLDAASDEYVQLNRVCVENCSSSGLWVSHKINTLDLHDSILVSAFQPHCPKSLHIEGQSEAGIAYVEDWIT